MYVVVVVVSHWVDGTQWVVLAAVQLVWLFTAGLLQLRYSPSVFGRLL